MNDLSIVSINVRTPQAFTYGEKTLLSAIDKKPVHGKIFLSTLNLDGDQQADLHFHGGPDKAVCVYSYDHYSFWESVLDTNLDAGAFGENLTVKGITEDDVWIGDVYELGEAIVQVTQPRQPCFKLATKLKQPKLPLMVQHTGYTGFYFRVLKEGTISSEDSLKLLERNPGSVSISYANKLKYKEKTNLDGIKKMLSLKELSKDWTETFTNRLKELET
ncbi:MAG: MOSC domain-containing protein [Bacillus sp. (in: firmicutes)]